MTNTTDTALALVPAQEVIEPGSYESRATAAFRLVDQAASKLHALLIEGINALENGDCKPLSILLTQARRAPGGLYLSKMFEFIKACRVTTENEGADPARFLRITLSGEGQSARVDVNIATAWQDIPLVIARPAWSFYNAPKVVPEQKSLDEKGVKLSEAIAAFLKAAAKEGYSDRVALGFAKDALTIAANKRGIV